MSESESNGGEDAAIESPGPRACARKEIGGASTDVKRECFSFAELEAIAAEIEATVTSPSETLRDVIVGHAHLRRIVVANAVRMLGAKRWYFDAQKKKRIIEPDYGLVFKALEFLADRADGKPAQASVNVNLNANETSKEPDTEDLLARSPAALEQMERVLARANKRAKERTINVTP